VKAVAPRRDTEGALQGAPGRAIAGRALTATGGSPQQQGHVRKVDAMGASQSEALRRRLAVVDMRKQSEAAFQAWLEAQRSLWERWLEASRRLSQTRSSEEWQQESEKLLDQWEESARAALSIPVEQTRRLSQRLSEADRVPREAVGWAEQVQRIIEQWGEAQRPLLDAWFKTARLFGPARRTGNWDQVMETWREAAGEAARAQAAWARNLVGSDRQEGPAEPQAGQAGSSSSSGRSGSGRSTSGRSSSGRASSTTKASRGRGSSRSRGG